MTNPNFMFENMNILKRVHGATTEELVEVAYRLAETHPTLFCRLLTNDLTVDYALNGTLYGHIDVKITRDDMDKLKTFGDGEKVRAVKWLRENYGIGLKEAKDLCEWLVRDGHLPHKCWMPDWLAEKTMKPLADGWTRTVKTLYPNGSLDELLKKQMNE